MFPQEAVVGPELSLLRSVKRDRLIVRASWSITAELCTRYLGHRIYTASV